MELGALLTKLFAIGTVLGNLLVLVYLLAHVFAKETFGRISAALSRHALSVGFLVSFAAAAGSYLYSEVTGYPACILCWLQRVFMYPLPFLFGLALLRRDRAVLPYALLLSTVGGAIALYNWAKDMLALYTDISLACPVVPGLPSCDRIYVLEFGYVTIAMFALGAFLLIALVAYSAIRTDRLSRHG